VSRLVGGLPVGGDLGRGRVRPCGEHLSQSAMLVRGLAGDQMATDGLGEQGVSQMGLARL
jgi:hypothetical protein